MAKLRRRGGVWYASWYVPQVQADGTLGRKREERSTGQRDRALARDVARRFERESIAIAEGPEALRLDIAIAQFMAHLEALRRSPETLAFYVKKSKPIRRILGDATDVHQLGPRDVTRYMHTRLTERVREVREGEKPEDVRRVGPHTVQKELALLRAVLRWHAAQGRFEGRTDWCVPGELRGAYEPGERALSVHEYRQLHDALSETRRDYVAVFVGTGVRDSELYGIEARDVIGDRLHVRGKKTRRADRWLPLRPELAAILKRRAKKTKRGPLFPTWGNVRRDLHAACARAKIDPVSPNDLRRTFATWHAEAGTPELVVVSLMGHASSAMVRRVYARVGSQAQAEAAARFPSLV